jgi:hypothetical protein
LAIGGCEAGHGFDVLPQKVFALARGQRWYFATNEPLPFCDAGEMLSQRVGKDKLGTSRRAEVVECSADRPSGRADHEVHSGR